MIKNLFLLILGILTIQSCHINGNGTWINDHIEKEKREQVKILNDKLFAAIIGNDVSGVKALFSDKLTEKLGQDFDKELENISSSFKSDGYKILQEYNVQNSSSGNINSIPSGFGEKDFSINYQALNKEMYVSLLLPVGLDNDLLITVIYGKYGKEWKINILQFGQYSFFNKTAPDYYLLAKENYEKGHLLDAVDYIGIAKQCLLPANDYFHYQKEKEISDFYDKAMKEAKSNFVLPMTLENITTKPKVFRVYPEMINEGFFPMVCYLTEISLKDSNALKTENEKIKTEVNRIFKGIDKDKKFVFYKAFNEMPDGVKKLDQYGFVDELQK